ncbi:hypothetical protein BOTNAR_0043g00080 [Botryotinia narcissicola]|uniref:Uncharacterized protein n=1 Tax=Botryotinia narcissicola TaxID=278944 RepID=A0A4Z1J2K2_9HELO|nr:hypothetical protein BOTNAR_0043g00080 [Botryotinia narcissicola]
MPDLNYGLFILLPTLAGLAAHLGYFIHGEHHMQSLQWLLTTLFSPLVVFLAILKFDVASSYVTALKFTAIILTSFFTSLTGSILTYRVFFHPLRHFPGPFGAKCSKLTHVARLLETSDNYLQVHTLHDKYGDIVRIGPNELSIIKPEAVKAMIGPGSKCTKSAWYDVVGLPHTTMHLERDRVKHDKRRKVWDRGFSAKALRNYEGRVTRHADDLVSRISTFGGKAINATHWFNAYAFDVIGDLAFGKSFDMLKTGEKHFALKILQEGMEPLGILTPIPWVFPILIKIPGAMDGFNRFVNYCAEHIDIRRANEPSVPDIMTWLIDAEKNDPDPIHRDTRWLHGDSRLAIIAGSDTTSATLTYLFYHLCLEPHHVAKLREELEPIFTPGSPSECRDIQDAPYLNAVINETLRLHPPVPSGLLRQTPPEGLTIDGTYIQGDVVISAPTWTMGRLKSCYPSPHTFLPTRWFPDAQNAQYLLDKSVFTPFSAGNYSCIGKQLALMELRAVVARMVMRFEIGFAEGERGEKLLGREWGIEGRGEEMGLEAGLGGEQDTKEVFTLELGELRVRFRERG